MSRDLSEPAQRVAWAVAQSGKTLEVLAAEIGCTHATLSNWQRGDTTIYNAKAGLLVSFCHATGTNLEWVLTGSGPALSRTAAVQEPALVQQARHIVRDLSPEVAATAYRLLAALEAAPPPAGR